VPNQNGYSVLELLVVFVIVGLLALMAYPSVRRGLRGNSVRGARTTVVALYAKARASAVHRNRTTALRFSGNSADMGGGVLDTLGGVEDLHGDFGVSVSASDSVLWIDARGLGMGSGTSRTTIALTRDSETDTVEISGFGRVVAQ
jgi:prepilin-type N-terminal cleavage/methylation domain-containing protein